MVYTDDERQTAINIYKYVDNGKEIFPREIENFTPAQKSELDMYMAQQEYLESLKRQVCILEDIKKAAQARRGYCSTA